MDIRIDTTTIFDEFKNHINLQNNERILFSSKFGTGKSTFLSEYFKKYQDYNVFKIYPVSYSISQNEDIFELIKYDILYQLLARSENGDFDLIDEDYSQILTFQFKFLKTLKLSPILFKVIDLADKTGKFSIIKNVIEKIKEQYVIFKEKHQDEEEDIYDYLYKQYSKAGSPRENDLISQLIYNLLNRLTKENLLEEDGEPYEKEKVLIIDDLDRLDPEHIFRLFNIFSVNFGSDAIQNKFGFDKIIFVCDLDNIRKIYEHRYGVGVDFEGYIDKFYSNHPFKFDTNQLLTQYVVELLQGFNLPSTYIDFSDKRELLYYSNFIALKGIINTLIIFKKINLRTLLNSKSFILPDKLISFDRKRKFLPNQLPLVIIFQILVNLFDSKDVVESVLNDLSNNFHINSFANSNKTSYIDIEGVFNTLLEMSIPFITNFNEIESLTENLGDSDGKNLSLNVDSLDVLIRFTVSRNFSGGHGNDYSYHLNGFSQKNGNSGEIQINPYSILLLAFKKCINLHMI